MKRENGRQRVWWRKRLHNIHIDTFMSIDSFIGFHHYRFRIFERISFHIFFFFFAKSSFCLSRNPLNCLFKPHLNLVHETIAHSSGKTNIQYIRQSWTELEWNVAKSLKLRAVKYTERQSVFITCRWLRYEINTLAQHQWRWNTSIKLHLV